MSFAHVRRLSLFISAFTLCGMAMTTQASPAQQQLSQCLIESTTAQDKTTVLQWTFAALAQHPDLKAMSQVTAEQKNQLDQNLAQVLQRIVVEQCASQAKAVMQAEGVKGVTESLQALGQETGQEILQQPEIKNQLNGVLKYIDLNKLMMTFLSPDMWNRLGTIRGQ